MPPIYNIKKGELPSFSVIDYNAFKYYRDNNKYRNPDNTANYVAHGKILSKFYEKVGQKMVEGTGGVFIEGLGYFGAVINPKKNIRSYFGQEKLLINKSTSGYSYSLAFVPISKDNILREYVADNSFSTKVKKAFSQAVKSGKKYSFNFLSFFNRYGKMRHNQVV